MLNYLKNSIAFIIIFSCVGQLKINAQCIASFPYHENFETNVGGWITGGTNNSWVWGAPLKPIINSAGQGLKCWVTGGLSGASYNNAERSWVQSPCFDFTNLLHPYIQFKIFWESERKFDGGNLQYSINNGTTWINIGTVNTVTDCYNDNWYNYNNITYLTTLATIKEGWCGNKQPTSGSCQGGFGSNNWVIAKHCLNNLTGVSNVIFRFTFGAGTSCNAFDGLAFDDVIIQNAPRYTANFGYNCTSNSTFNFTDSSTNCPTVWHWNFNDVASGVSNTSTLKNPTHHFTNPGLYQVQLIATNTCSGSDTLVKTISVLGLIKDSLNITCPNGNDGMAAVQVVGSNSSLTYLWNTTPIQTNDSILNVSSGTYSVVVSQAKTCAITTTFNIKKPNNFSHSFNTTPSICGSSNGAATIAITGGTPNYTYTWLPAVSSTNVATNINSGNYVVQILDAKNCVDTMHLFVPNAGGNMNLSIINKKNVSCFGGNDGKATVQVVGGAPTYHYVWSAITDTTATVNNLSASNYLITVTDANNCTSQIVMQITQPTALAINHTVQATSCAKNNGRATSLVNGGTQPYSYTWVGNTNTSASVNNLAAGNYFVQILDSHLCKISDTILVANSIGLQIQLNAFADTCNAKVGAIFSQINSGTAPFIYAWYPLNSNQNFIKNLAHDIRYTLIVKDSNLCTDTAFQVMPSLGNFKINLGDDKAICIEQNPIILSPGNFVNCVWQDGSTQNKFVVKSKGVYSVVVKNQYGCTSTDSILIDEHCIDIIQMPNSFTPNNDGIDDDFGGITNSPGALVYYNLRIFNRWGQEVFHSNDYNDKWNGNFDSAPQPLGAYVFLLEYSFDKNQSNTNLKGDLILIR